jgi:hypothetical protein
MASISASPRKPKRSIKRMHEPRSAGCMPFWNSSVSLMRAAHRLANQFAGCRVVAGAAQRLGTPLGRNAHGDLVGTRAGRQLR